MTLFTSGFAYPLAGFDFYLFYVWIIPFTLFCLFFTKFKLSKNIILFFIIISIHVCLTSLLGGPVIRALVQLTGILLLTTFFYYLLLINKNDWHSIYDLYIHIAFYLSLVVYLEVLASALNIPILYDYSWLIPKWRLSVLSFGIVRAHSILPEPAHYIHALLPAFYISMHNLTAKKSLFISKFKSLIIFISFFLTFSSVGYLSIFLCTLVLLGKKIGVKVLFVVLSLASILFAVFSFVPEVSQRFIDTYVAFSSGDLSELNVSTIAFYNNAHVAISSFIEYFPIGGGLGSHPISFEKYSLSGPGTAFSLNSDDANSLLFRMISELGVLGFLVVIFLCYKLYIFNNSENTSYTAVSKSLFVFFFAYLLRQGHYFLFGLPLFIQIFLYIEKPNSLEKSRETLGTIDTVRVK